MNKQLLQRALDALEKNLQSLVFGVTFDMTQAAIEELRAAIDAVAPYHMPDAGKPAFVERTTEDILRDALNLAADTCESTLYVEGDGTVSVFGPKTDANVEIRKCRDAIRALIKEIE